MKMITGIKNFFMNPEPITIVTLFIQNLDDQKEASNLEKFNKYVKEYKFD